MLSPSLNKDFTYLLKIIKIMSILKSIWSDSLVVSSQFEKDHPNLDQIFGWETFLCILFKSKLFIYFMPPSDYLYIFPMYAFFSSQSCSYILCHLLIIFTSFHLDIQY